MSQPRILVVGVGDGGATTLPEALVRRIMAADVLAGGARQLAFFPAFEGERVAIAASVEPALARLRLAWERGERAAVVASGDPLWYGVGASLRRAFPPEALEVLPGPASFQLAFAALAEPWQGAALLSAHARPLADVVAGARGAAKAAILTDGQHTPQVVAAALVAGGVSAASPCAVCENLGGPDQRVVRNTLGQLAGVEFAALNVLVVWPQAAPQPAPPGLPDTAFATEAGLITKREVRLLSLAELALGPGQVLWDIGAGSGSVGIEAARSQPAAQVFAIERREPLVEHARENLRRFPAPNLRLAHGAAPEGCTGWPDPDAVFIGGSGGRLAALVEVAQRRLRAGGRLVLNLATLEHLHEARAMLPEAQIYQLQISRGQPIQGHMRLAALNPIFIIAWRKAPAEMAE